MAFFGDFFHLGTFQRSLNSTFLVLIPKKGGVEDLKDFKQISLVGSLYKLFAEVLANKLKLAMGRWFQSSSMPSFRIDRFWMLHSLQMRL